MKRTLRSRRLRNALFRAADGKCQICGCELADGWHADHVVPWSRGGQTAIENMQALCETCNLRKGNTVKPLRNWQKNALRKLQSKQSDFFMEATPGSGKTTFACHAVREFLTDQADGRIIVVVPTTALKEQWAQSLHKFSIDAEWRSIKDCWPKGFQAICVTYQQVGMDANRFRWFCNENTYVVFDEVHHCGDEASWGAAIKYAFETAAFRLALSGTPFRSDSTEIPFLTYGEDGKACPDDSYGYGHALADKIVRSVFFPRQGGLMEWSTPQGELRSKTFDDELSENEANQRLYTALTTGSWVRETIADAHKALTAMREDDPDAGGLVIAIHQKHARDIAEVIRQETGVEPDVVLSDDPDAQDNLKAFAESSRPWIVAVKMVSEGVDIPRLRVGVYATNTKTQMFFRQAVGRFVRIEEDHDDPTSQVFIPDDPRLREFAETIKAEVKHQIHKELQEERERRQREREMVSHDASMFMPLNSSAEHKGTIVDDLTLTKEQVEEAARCAGGMCSPLVAAQILINAGHFKGNVSPVNQPAPARKTRSDRRMDLRRMNKTVAGLLASDFGLEHKDVQVRLNRMCGIQSVASASIEELEKRIDMAYKLRRQLTEGRYVSR